MIKSEATYGTGEHFSEPLRTPRWLLFTLVIVSSPILLVCFYYFDDPIIPSDDLAAVNTLYQFSNAATPPASGWISIAEFNPAERVEDGSLVSVWQVFEVRENFDEEQLAIFLPVLFANYRIYVGDNLIAQPAPMKKPLYVNRVPRLFPIARSQLEEGNNRIFINSVRENPQYAAYPLFVGSFPTLDTIYQSHRNQRVFAPFIALVIMLLLTVAIGILWLLSPGHTYYGWYALVAGLFAAHSGWFFIAQAPISAEAWSLLGRLTVLVVLPAVIFYHRYFGLRRKRIELVFAAILLISAGYLSYTALFDFPNYLAAMDYWAITTVVINTYAIMFLLWALYKWRNFEALILAVNSVNGYVVGIRDLFFQMGVSDMGYQYYLQYSSTVSACLFGYLLIRRFAASMREVEELNEDLELRVDEKASELEATYSRLADEESKRLLAEERARIMRDMHDGLGGQLIHALALAERGADPEDVSHALTFAMQDLRLIIDSLAPDESTIEKLVASFRYRTTPILEEAEIQAQWQLGDDLAIEINPGKALALLRFLQEGITNAVKHANATQISIIVEPDEGQDEILVAVHDNGNGLAQAESHGRGMNNLRIRAQEMGGELALQSDQTGTSISCLLQTTDITVS